MRESEILEWTRVWMMKPQLSALKVTWGETGPCEKPCGGRRQYGWQDERSVGARNLTRFGKLNSREMHGDNHPSLWWSRSVSLLCNKTIFLQTMSVRRLTVRRPLGDKELWRWKGKLGIVFERKCEKSRAKN